MAFSDLHIETTKRLAAQRQIDAAISHLLKSELECAITLANGAEGLLPETESRQIFAYLREHPLSKQVDFDKTIGWLKHRTQPDAATIFEFEAAVVVVGGCEGALADDPVDEIMKLLWLPYPPADCVVPNCLAAKLGNKSWPGWHKT